MNEFVSDSYKIYKTLRVTLQVMVAWDNFSFNVKILLQFEAVDLPDQINFEGRRKEME